MEKILVLMATYNGEKFLQEQLDSLYGQEDVEVDIKANELRIDTYCASGAGGQYVNRTET